MTQQSETKELLQRLVDFYAKVLHLDRYRIHLEFNGYEDLESNYAEVYKQSDCGDIRIRFNCEKLIKEPEELEKTVIHELMHALFYQVRHRYDHIVKTFITDSKTRELVQEGFSDDEHELVFLMEEVLYSGFNKISKRASRKRNQ
jgi:hypothetical protein